MFFLNKQIKTTSNTTYCSQVEKQVGILPHRSAGRLITGLRLACVAIMFHLGSSSVLAQSDLSSIVRSYIRSYKLAGYQPRDIMSLDSLRADDSLHEIYIYANEPFCSQPFTPQNVNRIYADIQRRLPAPYNTYRLSIYNKKHQLIEELIPNIMREGAQDASRLWGSISYKGLPWVENTSRPYRITSGLQKRHLFIWPSHGRYYKEGSWQWQRPYLFCTTEDMFTQSCNCCLSARTRLPNTRGFDRQRPVYRPGNLYREHTKRRYLDFVCRFIRFCPQSGHNQRCKHTVWCWHLSYGNSR